MVTTRREYKKYNLNGSYVNKCRLFSINFSLSTTREKKGITGIDLILVLKI